MNFYEEFSKITDLVNLVEEFTENSRCKICGRWLRKNLVRVRQIFFEEYSQEYMACVSCWRCRGYQPEKHEKFRG